MRISRRGFVGGLGAAIAFASLARRSHGQAAQSGLQPYLNEIDGYGPLVPDPRRIFDLPKGFSYRVLSRTGDVMSDGLRVPGFPDGMGAFAAPDGRVIIVRNHEMPQDRTFEGPFGLENELYSKIDRSRVYDAGKGRPHLGGTTTIVFDPASARVEAQFLSLAGTLRNCAGGPTPWNSWISCEETVDPAGETNERDHGYAFEVPATSIPTLAQPRPLKAMGRFYREGVAVEPARGIVYQTEDRADGLLYRYVPSAPRLLGGGGRLQVLSVRGRKTCDTRNYAETGAPRLPVGDALPVRWLDIDDAENPKDDLRARGAASGAAIFARGEGIWYDRGTVYFACTTGGLSMRGQIFRYTLSPAEGTPGEESAPAHLQLFAEPNNATVMESCDNVTVAPWGDLIVCEDNAAPAPAVVRQNPMNYVRGITPSGKVYTLGRNRYPGVSELAGCCFAPNHPTMFVNIQVPGITLAVTGPWDSIRR